MTKLGSVMRDPSRLAFAIALLASVGTFALTAALEGPEWGAAAVALLVAISLAGRDQNAPQSHGTVAAAAVTFLAAWQTASLELALFLLIGASAAAILWRLGQLLRPVAGQMEERYPESETYSKHDRFSSTAVSEPIGPAYNADPSPQPPEPPPAETSNQPLQAVSEDPQEQRAESLSPMAQDAQSAADLAWEVLAAFRMGPIGMQAFEVRQAVAEEFPSARQYQQMRRPKGSSEWEYRVGWAVSCLRMLGAMERGSLNLTPYGTQVDGSIVIGRARTYFDEKLQLGEYDPLPASDTQPDKGQQPHHVADLRQEAFERIDLLEPECFEHFCAALLRAQNFDVKVTGGMGDGGIDGIATPIDKPGASTVYFQAKRWRVFVSPTVVREFRGSLVHFRGQGFLFSSSDFTAAARQEAERHSGMPIRLINRDEILEMMTRYEVGVKSDDNGTHIDHNWFRELERLC